MRFFCPEIERVLKTVALLVLLGLIVLPVSWGYAQRREARKWQEIACAYRVSEIARRSRLETLAVGDNPCARLEQIGVDIAAPMLRVRAQR
ncbi:MAG: hypothetical protein ACREJG_07610 [Candidatus Rokuibacteriota bacterium]